MLDGRVSAHYERGARVVVSGAADGADLRERLAQIIKEYTGVIEIVDRLTYQTGEGAAIPAVQAAPAGGLKVSSVVLGNPSYVETVQGKRLFVGARLPNGAEIVDIQAQAVTLRQDGKLAQVTWGTPASAAQHLGMVQ
jgi:hypothetical protein